MNDITSNNLKGLGACSAPNFWRPSYALVWGALSKTTRGGILKFPNLCKLMKGILSIPHSNASSERLFSMVRKIVTENRTDLGNDTVCALLSCKMNCDSTASNFTPDRSISQTAKKATYLYNQEHKKWLLFNVCIILCLYSIALASTSWYSTIQCWQVCLRVPSINAYS